MSKLPVFPSDYHGHPPRRLGHLPSDPARMRSASSWFGPGVKAIPEADWQEFDFWPAEVQIKDQGEYGACNGHAAALGLELARWAEGLNHVPLSAWWVYGNLTGGWDTGSNPMDALNLLTATGCAPESDVPWGMFNPRKFTAAAKSDAPRYRAEKSGVITDPDLLMTAVQLRQPLNATVDVVNGFNTLDSDGVPQGLGRRSDNHAITLAFGAKKTSAHGWCVKMANSWTTQWGLKGFCWIPLAKLCVNNGFECYALSAAANDPSDKKNPPVLA